MDEVTVTEKKPIDPLVELNPVQPGWCLEQAAGFYAGSMQKRVPVHRRENNRRRFITMVSQALQSYGYADTVSRVQMFLRDLQHPITLDAEALAIIAELAKSLGTSTDEPATGSVDFPITVPCTGTGDTTIGSTCSITTSFDAVNPGSVTEIKRSIWQLDRIRVNDGGADGLVSTTPNTLFAVQGVFIP